MNDIVSAEPPRRPERLDGAEDDAPVKPSQYWRYRGESEQSRKGRVYLIERVNVIDNEIHSVEVLAHPQEGWSHRHLLADFLEHYEFCSDGVAIRDQEIAEVLTRIEALQRQLRDATERMHSPALLAAPSATEPSASAPRDERRVTDLIATGRDIRDMQSEVAERRNALLAVSEEIKSVSSSLSSETSLLAKFYQERAKASLASVSDVMSEVKRLESGITTLGLFAGDGVEVLPLVEGEPSDAPSIKIYQRMLYLDEELLCDIDQGGADYASIGTFAAMLKAEPHLIDRIAPAQKCIVLMRFRRFDKEYMHLSGTTPDMKAMLEAFAKNQANKEQFLLVRNGENITMVMARDALQTVDRLFPRERDISDIYKRNGGYFRGIESSQITPADLAYVEARNKLDQIALEYRRILVLLYGLDQRLQLFGNFYDRQKHKTWLSLEFQSEYLDFVADEDMVLEQDRPTWAQFMRSQNAKLQPGSRIVIKWESAMTPDTAPGAVKYSNVGGDRREFIYNPTCHISITIAEKHGSNIVAKGEGIHRWRDTRRGFNVKLDLPDGHIGGSFLVLDGVTSEDLRYFIENRRERSSYLEFIAIFKEAYALLKEEEARAAAAMADMLERAGGPSQKEILALAYGSWRAANRHAELPTDSELLEKAKKAILRQAETISTKVIDGDLRAKIEAQITASGGRLVRLSVDSENRVTTEVELRKDPPMIMPFPWVEETLWSVHGKKQRSSFIIPHKQRSDLVEIVRAELLSSKSLSSGEWGQWKGLAAKQVLELDKLLRFPEEARTWRYLVEPEACFDELPSFRRMCTAKGKYILNPYGHIPVAAKATRYGWEVLALKVLPISAMLQSGTRGQEEVRGYIASCFYQEPKAAFSRHAARPAAGIVELTFGIDEMVSLGTQEGGHPWTMPDERVQKWLASDHIPSARFDLLMSKHREHGAKRIQGDL